MGTVQIRHGAHNCGLRAAVFCFTVLPSRGLHASTMWRRGVLWSHGANAVLIKRRRSSEQGLNLWPSGLQPDALPI